MNNEASTSHEPPNQDVAPALEPSAVAELPSHKRMLLQTKKRAEFVGHLLNNLDTLIYVELCAIYYMECSLFRLIIRALTQMMFLTPKPSFIPPAPQHRPYVSFIFGSNLICILLHLFTRRPEAEEAMRGYLHGGVIIDLIGQKGPTTKFHLVIMDILVLVLQCFMLAVNAEKERLATILKAAAGPTTATGSEQPRAEVPTIQDHDAEERGVVRNDELTTDGDIEMQHLRPRSYSLPNPDIRPSIDEERNEERERLLAEPLPRREDEDEDGHALDVFWSGTVVLADFHVLHNLRRQYKESGASSQTTSFSAEFASLTPNQRLNARIQQGVESLTA